MFGSRSSAIALGVSAMGCLVSCSSARPDFAVATESSDNTQSVQSQGDAAVTGVPTGSTSSTTNSSGNSGADAAVDPDARDASVDDTTDDDNNGDSSDSEPDDPETTQDSQEVDATTSSESEGVTETVDPDDSNETDDSSSDPTSTNDTSTEECQSRCNVDGATCNSSNDCKSGRCVDGVCCESSCTDDCYACSEALTGAADGICAPALEGVDPHDDCVQEGAASCGLNGECDGDGACAFHATSTVCSAAECSDGVATPERHCDGNGLCEAGDAEACGGYPCSGATCATSCDTNAQCTGGTVCIDSECTAPSDLLGACDESDDCNQGDCYSGKCGLTLIRGDIEGDAVPGGGSQVFPAGWFSCDANGNNLVELAVYPFQRLYSETDVSLALSEPLEPGGYLVLTGQEGSDPLTRTFTFTTNIGTAVVESVSVARSDYILLDQSAGDNYVLFEWNGADVIAHSETY